MLKMTLYQNNELLYHISLHENDKMWIIIWDTKPFHEGCKLELCCKNHLAWKGNVSLVGHVTWYGIINEMVKRRGDTQKIEWYWRLVKDSECSLGMPHMATFPM